MPKKIDPEVQARAVRLVTDHLGEYSSLTEAWEWQAHLAPVMPHLAPPPHHNDRGHFRLAHSPSGFARVVPNVALPQSWPRKVQCACS